MADKINNQADAIFTKNWNVYNKIIEQNYMFHRQFLTAINQAIVSTPCLVPLTVLDLGCGDVALFSNLLAGYNAATYTGYDTSAEVLLYAAQSLKQLPVQSRLVNDYLQNAAKHETTAFNFIYSSFAIHHLTDEQKIIFFEEVYDHLLAPGGIFIYVDVFKNYDQSREEYLQSYISNITTHWTALDSNECKLVEDHIRAYDFPMEKNALKIMLQQMGFSVSEPVSVDGVHAMLVLKK